MDKKSQITHKKVGDFLIENKIITQSQLDDALLLQKDNKERLLGEILVTIGALTKEQLIMSMEMFFLVTGIVPTHANEWLDQEEIDMIQDKIQS